jgi:hypothetical protein
VSKRNLFFSQNQNLTSLQLFSGPLFFSKLHESYFQHHNSNLAYHGHQFQDTYTKRLLPKNLRVCGMSRLMIIIFVQILVIVNKLRVCDMNRIMIIVFVLSIFIVILDLMKKYWRILSYFIWLEGFLAKRTVSST